MAQSSANVLIIDDEKSVCLTCSKILKAAGHRVEYVLSGVEGVRRAAERPYDIVLLDLKMPDMSGMEALEIIKRDRPETTVIIITGYATIQTSIEAVKKGAFNYVPKPFTPEELSVVVEMAMENRQVHSENEYLKKEISRLQKRINFLGRSKASQDIKQQILKIAPTDFTVTIYGESGTGKELIAQAIHENSQRSEKPFVAVDVSALTQSLVESELFGHVKGAFTGATRDRAGHFATARGGTLFLDEIANISLELQGKLLRALESQRIRPVGSELEQEVDVRIVTATNRDLYKLMEEGQFREDLYYRLNVIPITVPPLRDRTEDIPLLAEHFLKEAADAASPRCDSPRLKCFTTAAMAKLISYHWPGNVRELKNITERIVATVEGEVVGLEHLPPELTGRSPCAEELGLSEEPRTAKELISAKKRVRELAYGRLEEQFVCNALSRAGWNVTRAAELVGMQRTNFHGLMRKYNIRAGKKNQNKK